MRDNNIIKIIRCRHLIMCMRSIIAYFKLLKCTYSIVMYCFVHNKVLFFVDIDLKFICT